MIKYKYNSEGLREVKGGEREVRYLLDGLAVLCEYDEEGIKREYVPGVSMKTNNQTYYYITDRLGSVRYVLDSSGSVVNSYSYTPFGQIHSSSGLLSNPYQFVGGEFYWTEEEIGLYLLGQRWYDAEVGRFISRDPIGEFTNTEIFYYKYAFQNPLKFLDPMGLFCIWAGSITTIDWIRVSPIEIGIRWKKIREDIIEDLQSCVCEWQLCKARVWKEIPYYKKKTNWICYERCKGWYQKTTEEEWVGDEVERSECREPLSPRVITVGPVINPLSPTPLCLCKMPQ